MRSTIYVYILLFLTIASVASAAESLSTNATGDKQPFNYPGVNPRALGQTFTLNDPSGVVITNISVEIVDLGSAGTGWFEVYELNTATGLPTTTKLGNTSTFSLSSAAGNKMGVGMIFIPAYNNISIILNHTGTSGNPTLKMSPSTNPYAGGTGLNVTDSRISKFADNYDFFFAFDYQVGNDTSVNLTLTSAAYSPRLLNFNATAQNRTQIINSSTNIGRIVFGINNSDDVDQPVLYNVSVFAVNDYSHINKTFEGLTGDRSILFNYSVVNVSVYDIVRAAKTLNFTATLTNNNTGVVLTNTTRDGTSYFYVENGNYTLTVDPQDLQLANSSLIAVNGVNNVSFSLYTTNSINFTFRNEATNAILVAPSNNVTVELIGTYSAYNRTTGNGSVYLDLITPDIYTIRYRSTGGFDTRSYIFRMTNRTHQNLTLYLLQNTLAQNITLTVYDDSGEPVSGATVKVLKYNINTNTYDLKESLLTDSYGQGVIKAQLNTEYYKFVVEYPFGTTKFTSLGAYITSTNLNFFISTSTAQDSAYKSSMNIDTLLTYNTATENFRLDYNDPDSTLSQMCLRVYRLKANDTTMLSESCSVSPTGTILAGLIAVNGTTYEGRAYVTINGDEIHVDSYQHFVPANTSVGNLGLLFAVILTLVFVFALRDNIVMAVLVMPLPLTIMNIIGFTYLPAWIISTIWVVAGISVYMMSQRA